MTDAKDRPDTTEACLVRVGADLSAVEVIRLKLEPAQRPGEPMLLSWHDRDRDFESPQHTSKCHLDSAIPGYVDYGLSHGTTLMIDIDDGRFVFFYPPTA
jgi:hypothetical protein